ncbi:MAG: hypothetical protein IJG13_12095 [Kiritimatiellae bacterium]|nr:hypothetical protein [Kiritimatiellia bacterium]MBQ6328522.1 hypothetical protein [Kiritimatiellia bacterium]
MDDGNDIDEGSLVISVFLLVLAVGALAGLVISIASHGSPGGAHLPWM